MERSKTAGWIMFSAMVMLIITGLVVNDVKISTFLLGTGMWIPCGFGTIMIIEMMCGKLNIKTPAKEESNDDP